MTWIVTPEPGEMAQWQVWHNNKYHINKLTKYTSFKPFCSRVINANTFKKIVEMMENLNRFLQ